MTVLNLYFETKIVMYMHPILYKIFTIIYFRILISTKISKR